MNKFALTMAAVALALGASAQDLDQKVTYTGPAISAKKLLEALSAQAGIELATSPQTAADVLVVVAKDVRLGDLLKRIAEAEAAEWKQEAAGYRLVRTEALAREQQRADVAERAKGYEAAVQRLLGAADTGPAFDDAAARRIAESARQAQDTIMRGEAGMRPSAKDPASRALARLLAGMPATTLASIPPNTRVVFANAPNRMQRLLGPNAGATLATFLKEQNVWAQALTSTPRETDPPGTRRIIYGGPDLSAKSIDRIGKALLIVHRYTDRPMLSVEFKVADSTGKIVARATETLSLAPPTPAGGAPTSGGRALKLSDTAKEFATLMAGPEAAVQTSNRFMVRLRVGGTAMAMSSPGSPPAPAVGADWTQRLSRPEANEPLDYVTGEVLRSVAADLDATLVASIPDGTLIETCRRMLKANLTAEQFLGFAQSNLALKVTRESGWIVIGAAFPSEVLYSRVDRLSLGQLLRTAVKNTYLRLDEMAAYALRQPDGLPAASFDDRYLRLLAPDAGQDFDFNGADRRLMLRLYGTLNSAQRSTLSQGAGVAFGRMDARQTALIAKMVFDSPGGPQISSPTPQDNPQQGRQVETRTIAIATSGGIPPGLSAMMGGDQALMDERTEALPFGLPGDGVMNLAIETRPGTLATRKDGSDARFLSSEDLAGQIAASSRPELSQGAQPYSSFRMASIRTLAFQFALSREVSMGRELRDAYLEGSTQPMALDQLPCEFKQMVERQAAALTRGVGNLQITRQGSPPPPPHL